MLIGLVSWWFGLTWFVVILVLVLVGCDCFSLRCFLVFAGGWLWIWLWCVGLLLACCVCWTRRIWVFLYCCGFGLIVLVTSLGFVFVSIWR